MKTDAKDDKFFVLLRLKGYSAERAREIMKCYWRKPNPRKTKRFFLDLDSIEVQDVNAARNWSVMELRECPYFYPARKPYRKKF